MSTKKPSYLTDKTIGPKHKLVIRKRKVLDGYYIIPGGDEESFSGQNFPPYRLILSDNEQKRVIDSE